MTNQLYTATAISTSAPDQVRVVGPPERVIEVSAPSALGGSVESSDPEQLYAAALSACLHQAVVVAGTAFDADVSDAQVRADVRLEHDGRLRYGFDASVTVDLPHCSSATYDEVVKQAMATCPMVGGVDVHLGRDN